MPEDPEVIVIGAGAAGLAAAAELTRAGRRTLLLEARDRIGGRILTRHEPQLASPIELGAEFIHGHAPPTRALLEQAGLGCVDAAGGRWILKDGQLEPGDTWLGDLIGALAHSEALKESDLSFDQLLERLTEVPEATRVAARRMVEGFDAADPARASARAIVSEWTGDTLGDAPQSRPEGGYTPMLAALAGRAAGPALTLRLQACVSSVRWSRGAVQVGGTRLGREFGARAPRAIVTVPLGVLKAPAGSPGALAFEPPLVAKAAALAGLASGSVVKVLLQFDAPFWRTLREGRYRDASFFVAPGTELPTYWTAPHAAPLLIAWSGGPRATRAAALGVEAQVQAALAGLEKLFGPEASVGRRLQACYCHDWEHDPHARGAYSYVLVGGETARAGLAAPLEDTLFFAGEATDTADESGTVAGALASGTRAAREVLASLT